MRSRHALTALLVLAGSGVARAELFDFEDQVAGNPPNVCGVSFIDGSYRIYDRLDLDPSVPPNDLAVRRVGSAEFADPDPLVMRFDAGVLSVTLNAGHQFPTGAPITATLEAFDALGGSVTSDTVMVDGTVTTSMTVASTVAIIREVHLTLGTGDPLEGPARTAEAIDDLDLGTPLPPCDPDNEPPTVTILYPTQDLFVQGDGVALVARVTDNEELGQITWTVQPPSGPPNVFPADASVQPPSGQTDWTSGIPPAAGQAPIPGYAGILEVGANEITATVCDTALPVNNCTTSSPRSVVANILPDTLNLYVRAVELTQAAQDEITVSPFRRGSMFLEAYEGLPLIKDKTTFARVYPGLEGATSPVDAGVMLRASSIGAGGIPTPIGETGSFPVTVTPDQDFNPNNPTDGVIIPIPPDWDDFAEIEITAQVNPPNATWGQSSPGVPVCPACSIPVPECQDDPLDPLTECNDEANLLRVTQIRFVDPPRPGLRVVPVPITATAFPGTGTIGIQPGPLALLQNTYPVPDDPTLPVLGLQIDPQLGPIVSGASGCTGFLSALRSGINAGSLGIPSGQVFSVLGVVPNGAGCSGRAGRPGRFAVSFQRRTASTAHEIGHNRNLKHVSNWHTESTGGGWDEWPLPHGGLGWAGLDPAQSGINRVVPTVVAGGSESNGFHDMMSYGGATLNSNRGQRWISPRTYVRLLDALHGIAESQPPDRFCDLPGAVDDCVSNPDDNNPCPVCYSDDDCGSGVQCLDSAVLPLAGASDGAGAGPLVSGEFLVVSGEIEGKAATLGSVYQVGLTNVLPAPGVGAYTIEIRDSRGGLLESQSFEPVTSAGDVGELPADTEGPALSFSERVPAPVGIGSLQILSATDVLLDQAASANAPTVTLTAPSPGAVWASTQSLQTIEWTAQDPDAGSKLRFAVMLSRDAGATWSPLAVDVTGAQVTVRADQIAPSSEALLRVVASDGLLSGRDEMDGVFSIEPKPKSVQILRPQGHGVHPAAEAVSLVGQAWSLESGPEPTPLDGETLRFTAAPFFVGSPVSQDGAVVSLSLVSGIFDVTLQLLAPSTLQVIDQAKTAVWVSDGRVVLAPATKAATGLRIRGGIALASGSSLLTSGAAAAVFEPNGAVRTIIDLLLEPTVDAEGFPLYLVQELATSTSLGTIAFARAQNRWVIDLTLPGITPPPPSPAARARFMLRLGKQSHAAALGFDFDLDGAEDGLDNCPFVANADQTDSVGDGTGDACRCGDVSDDGWVNVLDAALERRFVAGLPPAILEEKCSVIGATECDAADPPVLRQFLAGLPPGIAQVCSAAVEGPVLVPEPPARGSPRL